MWLFYVILVRFKKWSGGLSQADTLPCFYVLDLLYVPGCQGVQDLWCVRCLEKPCTYATEVADRSSCKQYARDATVYESEANGKGNR